MKNDNFRKFYIAPSLEDIPGLKWSRGDEDDDIDDTEEETRTGFGSGSTSDDDHTSE